MADPKVSTTAPRKPDGQAREKAAGRAKSIMTEPGPAKKARQSKPRDASSIRDKAKRAVAAPAIEQSAVAAALDSGFAISPEERRRLIAEAAYFRAQRRGFNGGEEQALKDWLEAEAEIDQALAGAGREQEKPRD